MKREWAKLCLGVVVKMNNWFVFYVQTGKEETVCKYLNNMLNCMESVSFVPQIEMFYKNSKQVHKKLKPMFPGYVFTETDSNAKEFATQAIRTVRNSEYIIRLLGKENSDFMVLNKHEKDYLLGFCDNKHILSMSIGIIKGDRVFVTSGPLMGRESIIKRIDRHKRRAEIEIEFMGDIRRVSVALEIVEKL